MSATLIWRLLPSDDSYPTVYLIQLRDPSRHDAEHLEECGWEAAPLDSGRMMFVTTDLEVALSSGITTAEWLDSAAISVE